jgi:hypothetical protein
LKHVDCAYARSAVPRLIVRENRIEPLLKSSRELLAIVPARMRDKNLTMYGGLNPVDCVEIDYFRLDQLGAELKQPDRRRLRAQSDEIERVVELSRGIHAYFFR